MAVEARINNHAGLVWSIADLLRGDYKPAEYQKVVLPLVLLRRLDCVLEPTKPDVLKKLASLKTIVGRMDDNADIFKRILDEPAFQATVLEHYLQRVFERVRSDTP